jgi:hypothetical protein
MKIQRETMETIQGVSRPSSTGISALHAIFPTSSSPHLLRPAHDQTLQSLIDAILTSASAFSDFVLDLLDPKDP